MDINVMSDVFKVYIGDQYNFEIKVNDAVKITVLSHLSSEISETFWVEIKSINENIITGKVNNKLIYKHTFDLDDIITFNKNNIKLVNKSENRMNLSKEQTKLIIELIKIFKSHYNREPTQMEFEYLINTRIIKN